MVTYPSITRLIDSFIVEFNAKITNHLTWLNNPLGKIEEISRHLENQYTKVPAMHTSDAEYIDVLPDDMLTNYSWFSFDPIQLKSNRIPAKIKIPANWNLYIDLEKVRGVKSARELENVKFEIINSLTKFSLLTAAVRVSAISEKFTDVYSSFNITNVEDRYFMQPFAAINCKMTIYLKNNICSINQAEAITADSNLITADSNIVDASGGTI